MGSASPTPLVAVARGLVVATDARQTVVIDLIGDLDSIAAEIFADALHRATAVDPCAVTVRINRLRTVRWDALCALGEQLRALRARGCALRLVIGDRRLRTLLAGLGVCGAVASAPPLPSTQRHVLIARHAAA